MRASLYFHIPFCLKKCGYCDFSSFDSPAMSLEAYEELLRDELALAAESFPVASVPTVYFGGGTPSLLAPGQVARLLRRAGDQFPLESEAEVTLEVNPGTVTLDTLSGYRDAGVNRLSVGVQSLDDRELALLGRIHTSARATEAIVAARWAGFDNIGIDLMHSLPGQSLGQWGETLGRAIDLGPEHISAYGLSIEEGTPFASMVDSGELTPADPDLAADMFELTRDVLARAGYEHYEISNFARPGCSSRHNRVYWRRGSYLGLGAAAHSFVRHPGFGLRWENPAGLEEYATLVRGGANCPVKHEVSREDAMAEFFFLGLRLLEGVDLDGFSREFGTDAETRFPGIIARQVTAGLLSREGSRLRLTRRGIMLANRVLAAFV